MFVKKESAEATGSMPVKNKLIKTIVRKEFLDHLLSFKFIACVLVGLVLTIISTVVLAGNYRDRLDDCDKGMARAENALTRVPVYSYLEVDIYKKPSPLSIIVPGIESRVGDSATITHREIPVSLKGGLVKNEFSTIFSFFDLSSIVVTIFTILAILLSYNSISGEKEEGTLSLALSNAVPRARFLAGKALGGIISLAVPLTLCFLVAALILVLSKGVELDREFFASYFLIYLFSLIYLTSVLLIGIFVSSRTRSSFQSLIILLAFYLFSVFLLPLMISSFAEKSAAQKARNYGEGINVLLKEENVKIRQVNSRAPTQRSWAVMKSSGEKVILGRLNPPETIAYYEYLWEQIGRLRVEYAQKTYTLRQKESQIREQIGRVRNAWLAFLPPSGFLRAAELEAGTGRDNLNRFFQQLALYWHQYVRYLDDKNAFSLRYFYPYSKKLPPAEKALLSELGEVVAEGKEPWFQSRAHEAIKKLNQQYEQDMKFLDLRDLPAFTFWRAGFLERLRSWSMNILILFLDSVIFLTLAHFSLARYDPRLEI
jgi:ABC-type transport system involved in multi-copper enzyme maturation permease subunit